MPDSHKISSGTQTQIWEHELTHINTGFLHAHKNMPVGGWPHLIAPKCEWVCERVSVRVYTVRVTGVPSMVFYHLQVHSTLVRIKQLLKMNECPNKKALPMWMSLSTDRLFPSRVKTSGGKNPMQHTDHVLLANLFQLHRFKHNLVFSQLNSLWTKSHWGGQSVSKCNMVNGII